MQLTCQGGVIFVDDYYNASWPGVHEGISKLYHTDNPSFVPFCYTCNKLFLTDMGHQRKYMDVIFDHVRSNYPKSRIKKVQRYGWETLTISLLRKHIPNVSLETVQQEPHPAVSPSHEHANRSAHTRITSTNQNSGPDNGWDCIEVVEAERNRSNGGSHTPHNQYDGKLARRFGYP